MLSNREEVAMTSTTGTTRADPPGAVAARRRHPWRPIKIAAGTAGALIALIAIFVAVGIPLYVFPAQDEIGKADLVFVIGPPRPERIALERSLREQGVAEQSLISTSLVGGFTADKMRVCTKPAVWCEHPDPYTTKGEAANLARFAPEHGVESTIVITFAPHVARARYIFAKCYGGDVSVVAVEKQLDLAEWIYQFAYQSAAFVKAWLTPCADAADL
jgi:hypothetical protein